MDLGDVVNVAAEHASGWQHKWDMFLFAVVATITAATAVKTKRKAYVYLLMTGFVLASIMNGVTIWLHYNTFMELHKVLDGFGDKAESARLVVTSLEPVDRRLVLLAYVICVFMTLLAVAALKGKLWKRVRHRGLGSARK